MSREGDVSTSTMDDRGGGSSREDLRRENERLRKLLAEASRLAEFGRYAAKLNHELKQPLFAIKGLAQLLLERDEELDPDETREFAASIVEQAERMGNLVSHLRTLSLPPDHRASDGKRGADVQTVVRKVMGLLAARLQKGVDVRVSVPEGLPRAAISEDAVQQILINLTTNALDAMLGRAAPALEVRARLEGSTATGGEPASLEIAVTDNGEGIGPEVRGHLFEPFFSTKTDDGTGLGLAVSRDLARAAGGDLVLAEGGTTTFVLTLPVLQASAGPSTDPAAARSAPPKG